MRPESSATLVGAVSTAHDPAVVRGVFSMLMEGRLVDPYSGEDLTELVNVNLKVLQAEKVEAALVRQKKIRREWGHGARPTKMGGLRTVLALDPVLAGQIRHDEGPDALADEGFQRDIVKHHPELGVPEVKGPAAILVDVEFTPEGKVAP